MDFNVKINNIWIKFSWLNVSVISCQLLTGRMDYGWWGYTVISRPSGQLRESSDPSAVITHPVILQHFRLCLSYSAIYHIPKTFHTSPAQFVIKVCCSFAVQGSLLTNHLSERLFVSSHFLCSTAMSAFRVATYPASTGCERSVAPGRPYQTNPSAPAAGSLKSSCICSFKLSNKRTNFSRFCSLTNGRSFLSHQLLP